MSKTISREAADCISCYREELLTYLVQRFGSLAFAQRVFAETQKRLEDCDALNYVPNPHIYLISYALSLGLEFMQQDMAKSRLVHAVQSLAPENDTCLQNRIKENTFREEAVWNPPPIFMVR